MKDVMQELFAVTRTVGTAPTPVGEARTVVLTRTYPADIADVWDALTSPDRIPRWFLPVSGELRLGGRYQFEGNTGGEVLDCEPPHRLRISWEMGEPSSENLSEVEVRLNEVDGGTLFELRHVATVPPQMWEEFGPGAVGAGWDGALLGLALYLASGTGLSTEDKAAWPFSDEGREFMTESSRAWGEAWLASGADQEVVAAAVSATIAFYVPPEGTTA